MKRPAQRGPGIGTSSRSRNQECGDGGDHGQPRRDVAVEGQGEQEEADVPVEHRILDADVAAVEPEEDLLPSRPRHAASDEHAADGREGELRPEDRASHARARAASPARGGRHPLDDPDVRQQERGRPQAGEAARQPARGLERPEDAVLAELVEPQQVGLEARDGPGRERERREAGEHHGGAHPGSRPPWAPVGSARPHQPGRASRALAADQPRSGLA